MAAKDTLSVIDLRLFLYNMRVWIVCLVFVGLAILDSPLLAVAQEPSSTQMTVKELRGQGWTVASTTSRNETRPGLPPYENLPRVLSITTFTLIRGDETITCEITYDSQRDTLHEHCTQDGS